MSNRKHYVFVSVHARRELEEMADRLDSLRRVYESELRSTDLAATIDLFAIAGRLRDYAKMERTYNV